MPIFRMPVVLHANYPHANCPHANCPHANYPSTVFFTVESESEIQFRCSEPETLDNPGNPKASGLSRISDKGAGFP